MARPLVIRVHTESPINDLWSYFRRYEVTDWLQQRLSGEGRTSAAEAAGYCVRQAREYFRSPREAPLLTRPVLVYYGMVSLGKLLLLLDETNPVDMDGIEAFERRGHGLKQWDPEATDDGTYHLENAQIEVTAQDRRDGTPAPFGVFPQLAARVCPTGGIGWLGRRFTLLELFRGVPQIDLQMRQAFGDTSGYSGLWIEVAEYADGRTHLRVSERIGNPRDAEELRQRAPYLNWEKLSVVTEGNMLAIQASSREEAYSLVSREELTGSSWTLSSVLRGERFEGLLAQYMLMYALSIIARYKPHRWAEILEGRKSPLLPVIERLMATAERWWPNLMLNRLERAIVLFAGSSYWG